MLSSDTLVGHPTEWIRIAVGSAIGRHTHRFALSSLHAGWVGSAWSMYNSLINTVHPSDRLESPLFLADYPVN
jgi:hypothetical protein